MPEPASDAPAPGRLRELVTLFGQLGVIGFGGPMAHIAMIEREAVDRRAWLTRRRFLDALAVTNLIPGPNSTEMAIHTGHVRAGTVGALGAGIAFILPAFALMVLLSWLYVRYQTVPAVEDVFAGIQPAVIALIVVTALRLLRGAVSDATTLVFFVASGALAYALPGAEVFILIGAGLAGVILALPARAGPIAPCLLLIAAVPAFVWRGGDIIDVTLLCLRTGGLLFGGGYVIIPLMEHSVVETFGWMTREQFLDGVALGQITPGPIVITATFVGYHASGLPGAALATVAIFLPSFFFAILSARLIEPLRRSRLAREALRGIAAAVVGTILAATAQLGRAAFVDAWSVAIALVALAALLRFGVHNAAVVAAAALTGLALAPLR